VSITILNTPIVQLERLDSTPSGPVVPFLTAEGMRSLREAYRKGEPWGPDGGRILTLVEDPFGCLGAV